MRELAVAVLLIFAGGLAPAHSQRKVDSKNLYPRVWAVVPIVGTGSKADPKRPLHAPGPAALAEMGRRSGIIGFSWTKSDDGKFALVEFVGRDRAALQAILGDSRQDVKKFEKGRAKEDDIVQEFKKYKRNFDPTKFGAGMQ